MTSNNPRLYNLLAILVATAALELGASQVHAMGFGFGILGGFNYVPSPGDFLNQHSLLNAGRAARAGFQQRLRQQSQRLHPPDSR